MGKTTKRWRWILAFFPSFRIVGSLSATCVFVLGILGGSSVFAEEFGVIAGNVYDSEGNPLPAPVSVSLFSGDPCRSYSFITNSGTINTASGAYRIEDIPPGDYYLATAHNETNYSNEWWASSGSTNACQDAEKISVVAGATLDSRNFTLEQGARISGLVSGNVGDNVCVGVYEAADWSNKCNDYRHVEGTSALSEGTYSVVVPAGTYFMRFDPQCGSNPDGLVSEFWTTGDGGTTICDQSTEFNVSAGMEYTKNITLDVQGGAVSGTVRDSAGQPLVGVPVHVNVSSGIPCQQMSWVAGAGEIDPTNGTYSIIGVPVGEYYLTTWSNGTTYPSVYWNEQGGDSRCSMAQTVTVNAGETTVAKDFNLEQGARISGTISGEYGDSVCVTAYSVVDGDTCDMSSWAAGDQNDNEGNFSFVVPQGSFFLMFNPNCGSNPNLLRAEYWTEDQQGTVDCAAAATFSLVAGDEVTKNISLDIQGGAISGTIFQSDGTTALTGESELGANVWIGTDPCNLQHVKGTSINVENGTFFISDLMPGQYYLRNWVDSSLYYTQEYWTQAGSTTNCSDAEPITVTAGQISEGHNFQLDMSGSVSGTFYHANGDLLTGAIQTGAMVLKGSDPCQAEHVLGINLDSATGTYVLAGLPPGDYWVQSWSQDGFISEYYASPNSTTNCSEAQSVTVVAGATAEGKDFQLSLGGAITGTLYETNGTTPISPGENEVGVGYYVGDDPCNLQRINGVWVRAVDGSYSISGLTPGQYYLETWTDSTAYYSEEYWAQTGSTTNCSDAEPITVTAGQISEGYNFQLDMSGSVSGTFYHANGDLLTGANQTGAMVLKGSDPCQAEHVTGRNLDPQTGTYVLAGLPPGDYWVRSWSQDGFTSEYWAAPESAFECSAAQSVTVVAGQTSSGKDFHLDVDTDGDKLGDWDEVNIYGTDPTKKDTDGDGFDDGVEVAHLWGDDYNGDADNDGTPNIAETDADNDGVSDREEAARGTDIGDSSSVPPPLVMYDDFSAGRLDAGKWMSGEYAMELKESKLRLFADSPGLYKQTARLSSITDTKIKATFQITDIQKYASDTEWLYFRVLREPYSTNADAEAIIGRVYTSLCIGDRGNGLEVWYYVGKVIDDAWNDETLASTIVLDHNSGLAVNTTYQLEIAWDGESTFSYSIYNESGGLLGSASYTGPARGATLSNDANMRVKTPESGGRINVLVDKVETGAANSYSVYDDFSSSRLDGALWSTPEIVKEVMVDGTLRLMSHSYGAKVTTSAKLIHRYNYLSTRVRVDSSRLYQQSGAMGRMRLAGYLYNTSYGPGSGLPYNGYEGNVWAQMVLDYTTEGGLVAKAAVDRTLDRDDTSWENLFNEQFDIDLQLDTDYILYCGFGGKTLVCGIDSADGSQHAVAGTDITSGKYPPYDPGLYMSARVYGNGNEGLVAGAFDNVMVGGVPGDINADGYVSLDDVIIGLQVVAGGQGGSPWVTGDTDGNGRLGLPEVLNDLQQLAQP